MRMLIATGLLAVLGALPDRAAAQIVWDTPRMIGPESPAGLGLYWMRAGARPGDEDVFFGTWSVPTRPSAVWMCGPRSRRTVPASRSTWHGTPEPG